MIELLFLVTSGSGNSQTIWAMCLNDHYCVGIITHYKDHSERRCSWHGFDSRCSLAHLRLVKDALAESLRSDIATANASDSYALSMRLGCISPRERTVDVFPPPIS